MNNSDPSHFQPGQEILRHFTLIRRINEHPLGHIWEASRDSQPAALWFLPPALSAQSGFVRDLIQSERSTKSAGEDLPAELLVVADFLVEPGTTPLTAMVLPALPENAKPLTYWQQPGSHLPPAAVAKIAAGLAIALQPLHDLDQTHGALDPGLILLAENGSVAVLGHRVARRLRDTLKNGSPAGAPRGSDTPAAEINQVRGILQSLLDPASVPPGWTSLLQDQPGTGISLTRLAREMTVAQRLPATPAAPPADANSPRSQTPTPGHPGNTSAQRKKLAILVGGGVLASLVLAAVWPKNQESTRPLPVPTPQNSTSPQTPPPVDPNATLAENSTPISPSPNPPADQSPTSETSTSPTAPPISSPPAPPSPEQPAVVQVPAAPTDQNPITNQGPIPISPTPTPKQMAPPPDTALTPAPTPAVANNSTQPTRPQLRQVSSEELTQFFADHPEMKHTATEPTEPAQQAKPTVTPKAAEKLAQTLTARDRKAGTLPAHRRYLPAKAPEASEPSPSPATAPANPELVAVDHLVEADDPDAPLFDAPPGKAAIELKPIKPGTSPLDHDTPSPKPFERKQTPP